MRYVAIAAAALILFCVTIAVSAVDESSDGAAAVPAQPVQTAYQVPPADHPYWTQSLPPQATGGAVTSVPVPMELTAPPLKYVSIWPESLHTADAEPTSAATAGGGFGKLLFNKVAKVQFTGPSLPTNSDGSFGGLAADDGKTLAIYERYIVLEERFGNGQVLRTVYPYDKLGQFQQLIQQ
jgi:hypothetical protein